MAESEAKRVDVAMMAANAATKVRASSARGAASRSHGMTVGDEERVERRGSEAKGVTSQTRENEGMAMTGKMEANEASGATWRRRSQLLRDDM